MESLLYPCTSIKQVCIFTKVLHLSEVHRRSELSHLSEVRSRQSTTSHNAFCGPSIKPQMPEVFHICFVGMNKSTVYFSVAFIHVVRMFAVALSLHLSRGRLCLRVHCLIDGILLFGVHTHLAFFFYIVAYCLCSRCRCTIHSVRRPHVSACPFLFCEPSIKPQMPEVFHICFVGMNKSTVYFSLAFIHVVRMFVVTLSLHLSRGRLCLRVHCLIDGILLFCVHTHLAFFFYIVAYCLCFRCRCTIHSVRRPLVSACRFLWATGSTEYFSFVSKRIVASCLS